MRKIFISAIIIICVMATIVIAQEAITRGKDSTIEIRFKALEKKIASFEESLEEIIATQENMLQELQTLKVRLSRRRGRATGGGPAGT